MVLITRNLHILLSFNYIILVLNISKVYETIDFVKYCSILMIWISWLLLRPKFYSILKFLFFFRIIITIFYIINSHPKSISFCYIHIFKKTIFVALTIILIASHYLKKICTVSQTSLTNFKEIVHDLFNLFIKIRLLFWQTIIDF